MANFKYKTASGGTWTDVPTAAYHGTLAGTFDVVHPQPQDFTIAGRVCAAVGKPYLIMQSQLMTGCGLNFWMSKFSASNYGDIQFWLTAYNTYTTSWQYYTGWLTRPTYQRVQLGSGSNNTLYQGVEVTMLQAASAAS